MSGVNVFLSYVFGAFRSGVWSAGREGFDGAAGVDGSIHISVFGVPSFFRAACAFA
jgi:hypothetical protein